MSFYQIVRGGALLASCFTVISAGALPQGWPGHYPAWWYNAEDPSASVVNISQLNEPRNGAPVNQGQLWHITSVAIAELDKKLGPIGGVGFSIQDLKEPGRPSNYYALVNVGQLKFVASKFFNRFNFIGFGPGSDGWPAGLHLVDPAPGVTDNAPQYPWLHNQTLVNLGAANVGQVKHLFSWDLSDFNVYLVDGDGDGLPDYWEYLYFGGLHYGATQDVDGDGLSNLTEYQMGLIPSFMDHPEIGLFLF